LYGTLQYCTVRYNTVRYATILYGTLQYCTVRAAVSVNCFNSNLDSAYIWCKMCVIGATSDWTNSCRQCCLLTPWSRVLLEKLTVFSRIFPNFVEPEGSFPHSQLPATCHCLEPARSSPIPHIQQSVLTCTNCEDVE